MSDVSALSFPLPRAIYGERVVLSVAQQHPRRRAGTPRGGAGPRADARRAVRLRAAPEALIALKHDAVRGAAVLLAPES
jgi:hypothetical protein